MGNCALSETLIELHVPDFQLAAGFYELLGFSIVWHETAYLVLKKGEQILCFYGGTPDVVKHSYFGTFPAETKRGYGVEIVLFDSDVDALYRRIKDRISIVSPLKLRPWGKWDFRLEDPFGYYIRVSERYDVLRPAIGTR